MENKSKKQFKKGCLIILAVFGLIFFLLLLIGIFADSGNERPESPIKDEAAVDSAMIKYNDSLRVEIKKSIDLEIKKFNTRYDDIEKITWIYSKTKPYYSNTMAFYTYIGLDDNGKSWKRLLIRYHGNDWLFINSIIIKADNQTYTISASDSKRDNNADVWEWIDVPVGNIEDVIIGSVVLSQSVKIRFVGRQYSKDWMLTKKEIKGLKEIEDLQYLLDSYSALNR
jgi:hypothetical protein